MGCTSGAILEPLPPSGASTAASVDMLTEAVRYGQARGGSDSDDAEESAVRIGSLMRALAVHVSLGDGEAPAA